MYLKHEFIDVTFTVGIILDADKCPFFLPTLAKIIFLLSPTYTKKHIHKNGFLNTEYHKDVLLRELSFQNILGATPSDCVLHLALTWSLMQLDKLTTVVYLKQK